MISVNVIDTALSVFLSQLSTVAFHKMENKTFGLWADLTGKFETNQNEVSFRLIFEKPGPDHENKNYAMVGHCL